MPVGSLVRILVLAGSLALDVFAVSVGVGVRGAPRGQKVRIGAAFALAEVTMTLIGAGIGSVIDRLLGSVAGYIGFAALIGVGIYMVVEAVRDSGGGLDLSRGWGLVLAALSISLDSLGIGFSILYIGVPFGPALAAIAIASVSATWLGLAFGAALGTRVGERSGILAGILLALTGAAFAVLKWLG
ncbi:MAG: manganese efflux pump MntP family protein [Vulcanimicrobiaceae bacterium]